MERISKKFQKFYDWMLEDKDTRISRNDFIKENHLSIKQIAEYEATYEKPPDISLEEQITIMDKELFEAARKPSAIAQMKQLWYTRHGLLIQKSVEIKVNLDADEYARLDSEAERELREEGFTPRTERAAEVQKVPALLS